MKKIIGLGIGLVLLGGGCADAPPAAPSVAIVSSTTPVAAPTSTTWIHPKFGFSMLLPAGALVVMSENGSDAQILDSEGVKTATLVVQAGIPGIALPDNRVEKLKLGGVAGHLYHDTDAATGSPVDKLIVDFPNGKLTAFIAAPGEIGNTALDLKAVAKSWKWKK